MQAHRTLRDRNGTGTAQTANKFSYRQTGSKFSTGTLTRVNHARRFTWRARRRAHKGSGDTCAERCGSPRTLFSATRSVMDEERTAELGQEAAAACMAVIQKFATKGSRTNGNIHVLMRLVAYATDTIIIHEEERDEFEMVLGHDALLMWIQRWRPKLPQDLTVAENFSRTSGEEGKRAWNMLRVAVRAAAGKTTRAARGAAREDKSVAEKDSSEEEQVQPPRQLQRMVSGFQEMRRQEIREVAAKHRERRLNAAVLVQAHEVEETEEMDASAAGGVPPQQGGKGKGEAGARPRKGAAEHPKGLRMGGKKLSDYETQRLANIEANHRHLESLGLGKHGGQQAAGGKRTRAVPAQDGPAKRTKPNGAGASQRKSTLPGPERRAGDSPEGGAREATERALSVVQQSVVQPTECRTSKVLGTDRRGENLHPSDWVWWGWKDYPSDRVLMCQIVGQTEAGRISMRWQCRDSEWGKKASEGFFWFEESWPQTHLQKVGKARMPQPLGKDRRGKWVYLGDFVEWKGELNFQQVTLQMWVMGRTEEGYIILEGLDETAQKIRIEEEVPERHVRKVSEGGASEQGPAAAGSSHGVGAGRPLPKSELKQGTMYRPVYMPTTPSSVDEEERHHTPAHPGSEDEEGSYEKMGPGSRQRRQDKPRDVVQPSWKSHPGAWRRVEFSRELG